MKRLNKLCLGVFVPLMILSFSSCGEFTRVQKSTNTALKYDYAKKYYNQKKWSKAADLLVDVVSAYDGTNEGAQALFMLGESSLQQAQGETAAECFRRYYNTYPKGPQAEEARYKAGVAMYMISPEAKLDQNATYMALQELQNFIEYYPQSEYRKEVEMMLFELQDKLSYKEYLAAKLYYDMGMYLGNNYQSAIVTANNALKDFPYTKYREEFQILILRASYKEALNSVESRVQSRLRNVSDRYFTYINEFPEGKYKKEAEQIYKKVSSLINNDL
ncbi:outer membrane protein assembly factor BamD [Porphyromonas circumdentaria]|uniref:Beta-barrel assembly machine subunit BamD n=1 Tax=Porphyromonas circumdentaria TaxID=29524 RepID=A0A1T4LH50_9PORP|nr:outer membrane protein assembly factor BamD [Porphyromonas circumdentaria]MBB6275253.1 outer membrane protein assembly factor BamD [Porphyromonas circumdentaria]MDO4722068.1 outer membrane protein assembly factor BamD [Porphyromonas circumdentaria]SJZ54119.1 Beta-barrel assembly machine subunit BamD [Porphyromonas circumdentaria]